MQMLFSFILLIIVAACNQNNIKEKLFKDGDIIFQTSLSNQSKAIQLATHSKFSHCGILIYKNNNWLVLEAVEPVKLTALSNWIAKGKDQAYVVKRLKSNFSLNQTDLKKMEKIGKSYLGKHYDLAFEWNDNKIYCSELVWKIYKYGANIELVKPQQLKDFDLRNSVVQQKLKERYGKDIPYNEMAISPDAIYNSDKLKIIYSNY
ncbi:MAG: YiiX family permuted papain-like enzyme [Chitinophagales bacterium]